MKGKRERSMFAQGQPPAFLTGDREDILVLLPGLHCSTSGHKGPSGWLPSIRKFSLADNSSQIDLQITREERKLFVALIFLLKIICNYMNFP